MNCLCPKCCRPLESTGSVEVDGHDCPVYQCNECLATVDMLGADVEVALTFAVDPDGTPFDPASPDGRFPFQSDS